MTEKIIRTTIETFLFFIFAYPGITFVYFTICHLSNSDFSWILSLLICMSYSIINNFFLPRLPD